MDSLRRLDTGIHVYSYKGVDGVTRFKVLTQEQYNKTYLMNVWWSIVKDSLSSWGIKTKS